MVDDLDTAKQSLITGPVVTDTSVTRYGVDLVLDGRIEYPDTRPMTVGSEELIGCVTA